MDKDGYCDKHTGGDDCNDNRSDIHPGAKQVCDGIDNNCDGATDEGCPAGRFTTNISGTGFSCADSEFNDSSAQGSSTGWLVTEWPVEPGEEFTLIFHVHDTSDEILDSEVLLDKFQFIGKVVNQGTTRVPED